MTIITVVIESTFSGQAGGFHGVKIDDSQPVGDLITHFCQAKGIQEDPMYALITKNNVMLVDEVPISEFFVHNGQVLRLIRTNSHSSKLVFRQWFYVAFIAVFVAFAGLITSILLFAVYGSYPDNFAVVIDAGAFQTDLVLYSWPGEKTENTGEVMLYSMCSAPGSIAEVESGKMGEYLEPCFEDFEDLILPASRKTTEVLFGGTTYMRDLRQSNPTLTANILSELKTYLEKSKWKYRESNVEILSSPVEGVSQWISSNFFQQKLAEKGAVNNTVGTMSIDSTATFINFEVPESLKSSPNVYPKTLYNNEYYVFSQRYQCYGLAEGLRRYRALLLIEELASDENAVHVNSPCEPVGFTFEASDAYFTSDCVKANFSDYTTKSPWNFIGTGNYKECERIVSKLLKFEECNAANLGECLDPAQIPADVIYQNFNALSSFSSIVQSLGIQPGSSLFEAQRHVKVMCDYTLADLNLVKSNTNLNITIKAFEDLCFQGEYMLVLLTQVYGFDTESRWSQIIFTTSGQGWSLGYMVSATNDIDAVPRVPKIPIVPFCMLIPASVVFFILGVGFFLHGLKVRKNSQKYQRLY